MSDSQYVLKRNPPKPKKDSNDIDVSLELMEDPNPKSPTGKSPMKTTPPVTRPKYNPKEVRIDTNKDFVNFVHTCGANMQVKLRKTIEKSNGNYKQWIEVKCWSCPTTFTPWKKNIFSKDKDQEKTNANKKRKR